MIYNWILRIPWKCWVSRKYCKIAPFSLSFYLLIESLSFRYSINSINIICISIGLQVKIFANQDQFLSDISHCFWHVMEKIETISCRITGCTVRPQNGKIFFGMIRFHLQCTNPILYEVIKVWWTKFEQWFEEILFVFSWN